MKFAIVFAILLPFVAATGEINEYNPSLNEPEVVAATSAINSYFLAQDSNAATRTAQRIISATKQTVAGVLYRYTIEMTGGDHTEACHVTVWSRVWLEAPDNLITTVKSCQ